MKVAVDIDYTINDLYSYGLLLGKCFCNEMDIPIKDEDIDYTAHFVPDQFHFNRTHEKIYEEWSREHIAQSCPPKKNAAECINKLINLGIEVYIMTARDNAKYDSLSNYCTGRYMQRDTYRWLTTCGFKIPYENILFGINHKGRYCKEYGFDVLVDDDPRNIVECVENDIPVILVTQIFNRYLLDTYKDKNVFDGKNDWIVIYNIIHDMHMKNIVVAK